MDGITDNCTDSQTEAMGDSYDCPPLAPRLLGMLKREVKRELCKADNQRCLRVLANEAGKMLLVIFRPYLLALFVLMTVTLALQVCLVRKAL